ncbi:hypothetical protein QPK87_19995 [Kamptonema cortianum]|nr:hypothetical protein [Geitlerinema splendidum]MDK3158841.1 hypothetical protein [Kamptonema cortianum]
MRNTARFFSLLVATLVSCFAVAGTITVTSPNANDFLGRSNTVSFNISGAVVKVRVDVKAIQVADPTVQISTFREFTPESDGTVRGSINLNLSEGLENGPYNIQVTATEPGNPYNVVPLIPVNVDVKDPEFVQFNPIEAVFVRGVVAITATFIEENIEEWRVTVNGSDIPNNTGNSTNLSVLWNSDLEVNDGPKTINITIKDKANNEKAKSFSVTVDRVGPTATIQAPTGSENILPGSRIPVVVEITDQYSNSVDERTVDVVLEDTSGNFLARVAKRTTQSNGNTLSWRGRIRDVGFLPSQFDVVVRSKDKSGNAGVEQRVRLTRGRNAQATEEKEVEVISETVFDTGGLIRSKVEIIKQLRQKRNELRSGGRGK